MGCKRRILTLVRKLDSLTIVTRSHIDRVRVASISNDDERSERPQLSRAWRFDTRCAGTLAAGKQDATLVPLVFPAGEDR